MGLGHEVSGGGGMAQECGSIWVGGAWQVCVCSLMYTIINKGAYGVQHYHGQGVASEAVGVRMGVGMAGGWRTTQVGATLAGMGGAWHGGQGWGVIWWARVGRDMAVVGPHEGGVRVAWHGG